MFNRKSKREIEGTIMSTLCPGEQLDVTVDYDGAEFHIFRTVGDRKEELVSCTPADGMLIMMCLSHMYGKKTSKAILNYRADKMWRGKDLA